MKFAPMKAAHNKPLSLDREYSCNSNFGSLLSDEESLSNDSGVDLGHHCKYSTASTNTKSLSELRNFYYLKNQESESLTQSLRQALKNLDNLRDELKKELYVTNLSTDKTKLLLKVRLEKFQNTWNVAKGKYKLFSAVNELDRVVIETRKLKKEYAILVDQMNKLKEGYDELSIMLHNKFKCKVVELSQEILSMPQYKIAYQVKPLQ